MGPGRVAERPGSAVAVPGGDPAATPSWWGTCGAGHVREVPGGVPCLIVPAGVS